ncbi:MAG: hypothetical protein O7H41_17075 [Planctomycetota bacterium]|nr:hypothetical protein [Planctomycetota bacterium]
MEKDQEAAVGYLSRLVPSDPPENIVLQARVVLASALFRSGRLEEAREAIREVKEGPVPDPMRIFLGTLESHIKRSQLEGSGDIGPGL